MSTKETLLVLIAFTIVNVCTTGLGIALLLRNQKASLISADWQIDPPRKMVVALPYSYLNTSRNKDCPSSYEAVISNDTLFLYY